MTARTVATVPPLAPPLVPHAPPEVEAERQRCAALLEAAVRSGEWVALKAALHAVRSGEATDEFLRRL